MSTDNKATSSRAVELYRSGMTLQEVGAAMGRTASGVLYHLRKVNEPTREAVRRQITPEVCATCGRTPQETTFRRRDNRKCRSVQYRCVECTRDLDVMRRHGITREQYQAALVLQGGGCGVCGHPTAYKNHGHLFIDHSHVDGVIRGLTCHYCNAMLGCFRDSTQYLLSAVLYLQAPPSNRQIPVADPPCFLPPVRRGSRFTVPSMERLNEVLAWYPQFSVNTLAAHFGHGRTFLRDEILRRGLPLVDGRLRRYAGPATHRVRLYGITDPDFQAMLESQGGVCAICGEKGKFTCDHDHQRHVIRGILCDDCNRGVGVSRERPELLQAGVHYLQSPPLKSLRLYSRLFKGTPCPAP